MSAKQYQKRPIVIEAMQHNGKNLKAVLDFVGEENCNFCDSQNLIIKTLEGNMTAKVGDYIIKGIKGEFYPCDEEIFLKTYEAV